MNKIFTLLFYVVCGFVSLLPLACGSGSSPATPATNPTGTGSTVTATSGDVFSPTSITITHGGAVTFTLSGGTHTLYIDNGSGICAQNYSTWPQVITFPTAGTYHFHCSIHSPCGTGSCSACTGMAGMVIVQ